MDLVQLKMLSSSTRQRTDKVFKSNSPDNPKLKQRIIVVLRLKIRCFSPETAARLDRVMYLLRQ
jgi:hypothetical protein